MESDSDIMVGCAPMGLLVMNKNDPSIQRHIQIDSGNLVSGMNRIINFFLNDKNGNIWLSTQEGYAKYDKQRDCLKPFFIEAGMILQVTWFTSMMMLQDKQGIIWLASKKGLGKLNPQTNVVEWFVAGNAYKQVCPL